MYKHLKFSEVEKHTKVLIESILQSMWAYRGGQDLSAADGTGNTKLLE
jgi:hypothetical protein